MTGIIIQEIIHHFCLDDDNILKWGVRNKSMMNDHAVQVDLHVLMSDTI